MYKQLMIDATPREAECFLIGCNLALRAGDLLKLRFDQMSATHVHIIEQKTGKKKQFPVTKPVREAVERLKLWYKSKNFVATYLFQSVCNRCLKTCYPVCIQVLGMAMKRASKKLNFTVNINTHSMRKSFGYHAYEAGADIHYLQSMFNHATSKVTLRYIGITKTSIEKMYFDHALEIV